MTKVMIVLCVAWMRAGRVLTGFSPIAAKTHRIKREQGTIVNSGLAHKAGDMALYGLLLDAQARGDLSV